MAFDVKEKKRELHSYEKYKFNTIYTETIPCKAFSIYITIFISVQTIFTFIYYKFCMPVNGFVKNLDVLGEEKMSEIKSIAVVPLLIKIKMAATLKAR